MKLIFLNLSFLVFCFPCFAKDLIITDIDDTLRPVNRIFASYQEQFFNVSTPENVFSGMPELLNIFQTNSATIYYVSGIIYPLEGYTIDFLNYHQFPQAENFFYKGWLENTQDYKVAVISSIIENEKPDRILLIGDNGERDVASYEEIAQNFPHVTVYIHAIYNNELSMLIPLSQNKFLTSADLALQLIADNWLWPDQAFRVLEKVSQDTSFDFELVLPGWAEYSKLTVDALYPVTFRSNPLVQPIYLKLMQNVSN